MNRRRTMDETLSELAKIMCLALYDETAGDEAMNRGLERWNQ